MKDYYSAACWADAIKKQPEFNETWKWHVIDMKDVTVPTILFDDSKTRSKVLRSDENNVVFKLYSLIHNTLLYSKDQRDLQNLRFIVHLLGDLHQPFHTTNNEDQWLHGFNLYSWFGGESPLLYRPCCRRDFESLYSSFFPDYERLHPCHRRIDWSALFLLYRAVVLVKHHHGVGQRVLLSWNGNLTGKRED